MKPWYMELPFHNSPDHLSRKDYLKLRRFYTQQLALSQALLEAKPLGICKTTISGSVVLQDTLLVEEDHPNFTIRKEDSKGMSS